MYWIVVVGNLIPNGFDGLCLFPFLLLRDKKMRESKILINHEKIHLKQQLELLLVIFYLWYVLEFLVRWAMYGSRHAAYRAISFEKEAYANETNLNYLKKRKLFSFINYF